MTISTRFSSRFLFFVLALTLAACQSAAPLSSVEPPAAAVPQPAPQAEPQPAPQPSPSDPAPESGAASAPMLSFYLAQLNPVEDWVPVSLNPETTLYALPMPVFTQADLSQVVPLQTEQGQVFLRFDFNESGMRKLMTLSQQVAGSYLILSINGQVVAVPQIAANYPQPAIHVPMHSAADAEAIVGLLRPSVQ